MFVGCFSGPRTAYAREEDRRLALEAGFTWHIAKPAEPAELLRAVAAAATQSPRNVEAAHGGAGPSRRDSVEKLERLISGSHIHEALRFLNSRTAHRFTAISSLDGETLRETYLFDAEDVDVRRSNDAAVDHSYCSIVVRTEQTFTTVNASRDERAKLSSRAARSCLRVDSPGCAPLLCDTEMTATRAPACKSSG